MTQAKSDADARENVLVSIITPSYNQAQFIQETIDSVLSQDYTNVEYLVIDGASSDGTQDVLKTYNGRLTWISEKDQGQADAVNKGFRRATGEIFGWLNSDDTYRPGAIRNVVEFFNAHPDISMVYGEGYNVDAKGRMIERHPTEMFSYQRLAETCFISQPTVFFRRQVFEELGPLDVNLHYCLDYEYWMRVGKRFKVGYIPEVLATTRFHGAAKTVAKRKDAQQEVVTIVRRHFSSVPLRTIYVDTFMNLLEQLMPNIQGLYPNGWTKPYLTIFLPNAESGPRFLVIDGWLDGGPHPLTLRLTCGGNTVERHLGAEGRFTLREELCADAGEANLQFVPERQSSEHANSLPLGRPFSHHLPSGRHCVIRRLTIIDDAGRETVLFSRRVAILFMMAFPILIVRNSFVVNGRLSLAGHCKVLWSLCVSIIRASKTAQPVV